MGFLDKIIRFFFPKPIPESSKLILPEESVSLLKQIENQRLEQVSVKLDELSSKIDLLAKNFINLIRAYRQQEEILVVVATLHEELLNQIEQGHIMLVKQQQPQQAQSIGQKLVDSVETQDKNNKKKDNGWN